MLARFLSVAVVVVVCVAASAANAGVVTFTENGSWLVPAGVTSVEYLVVGGGGGGGGQNGGGGGGGEFLTGFHSVTPLSTINITIGAGGAVNGGGVNNNRGSRGGSSFFDTIEAKGGGGGGGANIGQGEAGINTSSAGGNGWGTGPGSSRSVGGGVGYGDGGLNGGHDRDGGGGGGAGGDGGNGLNDQGGGFGGAGLSSSISGSLQWYAGGGGGAARTNAQSPGGLGGGGAGGYGWGAPLYYAQPGTPNTGGGGGGADDLPGIGGSGVVIVKWTEVTTTGRFWAPGANGGGDGLWSAASELWAIAQDTHGDRPQSTTETLVFEKTTNSEVTVEGTVTVKKGLAFNTNGYLLKAGSTPKIDLAGAGASDNTVTTAADMTATIGVNLDSTTGNGMTKMGTGTLVLSGASNSYGATDVQKGTLQINTANALPAGQALTIAADGTVVLSSNLSAAGAGAAAASATATAVPEPGTIALLAAGLAGLLVVAWRRRR